MSSRQLPVRTPHAGDGGVPIPTPRISWRRARPATSDPEIRGRNPLISGVVLVLILSTLAGCVEEKVVYNNPFLGRIPGAKSGTPVSTPQGSRGGPALNPASEPGSLRVEHPDGSITLVAKTGQQLFRHLMTTLHEGDPDLFVDEVLSERTRQEYYERGIDPSQTFVTIKQREEDLNKLYRIMPMGEFTPGVFAEDLGQKTRRIAVHGKEAQGLSWAGFDMVLEKGNWRFRWFVGGGS